MEEYIVRGNEEVYGSKGEIERERILPWIKVEANSLEEALHVGGKKLQEEFSNQNSNIIRIDLIFGKNGNQVLYRSDEIKMRERERAKEKFDLYAAIRDGCPIDESGMCTCGAGV